MFKHNKLPALTLALLLTVCCSQAVLAQPSFTSPVTCINADPNTSTQAYNVASNGSTINSITLWGDLQLVSVSPALPTTSNIVVTVKSKNVGRDTLNDCIGYLSSRVPNAKNFGFGKGRIQVNYTVVPCNNFIFFDVYKTFSETPPIVGPKCAAIGDTITYSVCSILSVNQNANIGIDKYVWGTDATNIPGLQRVYKSGDSSSVTYKVITGWAGGTLSCKFGQCNSGTSTLTVGIKTLASTVNINSAVVASNGTTCVSSATTPINLFATAPTGFAYTYSWSTNNSSWGFGATSTPTTTSVSNGVVSLNINESAGAVYLTTLGGCNARTDTFYIKRNLAAPLVIKRTDAAACITPGTNITFFINNTNNNANLSGLSFTWSVLGWAIVGNATGPTITAVAGSAGGIVTVTANGCTGTLTLPVNVTPAQPGVITGNACVTQGATTPQTYSVTNVGGLTYTWSHSGTGWTSNGSTTNTVIFTPVASATAGTVSVVANSAVAGAGTCSSIPRTLQVLFNPSTPTGISVTSICGTAGTCIPGGLTTTVVLTAAGGTGVYNWSIPAAFGSLVSTSGATATVTCLGTPNIYTIGVYCTNGSCTQSGTYNGVVQVQPAATLDYTQSNIPNPVYDLLAINLNGGCTPTGYCWKQNNTGSCLYATQSILLQGGAATSYTVTISYGTCSRQITQATRFTSRFMKGDSPILPAEITINPNPAADNFTLVLPSKYTTATASIYSSKGSLVKQQLCKAGSNNFNTSRWANGEYVIKLNNSKGQIATRKVIINR